MSILCLLKVKLAIQSQSSTFSGCEPQNAALCHMVTSFNKCLSDGTSGDSFWDCRGAQGWGKEQEGVPSLALGGHCRGRGVSQALLVPGALLWSCCLAHPGSGLAPIWNRAHWLLMSFRVAFFERQKYLPWLVPRKRCGSSSFTGPGQVSSLTLTTGLGLRSSERPGGWTVPAFCR